MRPLFCAVTGRQPVPRQSFSGAREARERYDLSGRQAIPRHSLHGAHELRQQYAVAGLGISPLASGGNGFQKDRHPLRWFLSSWDSIFRPFWDTSERRNVPFLLRGVTEKKERQYRYQLVGRKAPFLSQLRSSR